jgi:hypothetical protein
MTTLPPPLATREGLIAASREGIGMCTRPSSGTPAPLTSPPFTTTDPFSCMGCLESTVVAVKLKIFKMYTFFPQQAPPGEIKSTACMYVRCRRARRRPYPEAANSGGLFATAAHFHHRSQLSPKVTPTLPNYRWLTAPFRFHSK